MSKTQENRQQTPQDIESVVVRIAGDSGDGIQLTGMQFANEAALGGHDVITLPNYPAEIRSPAGSLEGVSAYQIHIGAQDIHTSGDRPDVLVAFNPAALKVNLAAVKSGGVIIINDDAFTEKNLAKAGYDKNPLEEGDVLTGFRVHRVPISKIAKEALLESGLKPAEIERCKNFVALGIMLIMFNRQPEATIRWIDQKFAKKPALRDANSTALKAGMAYAEASEICSTSYALGKAPLPSGYYRNIDGTTATVYGLISASQKSGLPLFLGAYPITPATDILHELSRHKRLGVVTFQAEDEIAAIGAAIGASFSGALGVTSSSGPGISLKTEALGFAVMAELPLVIINVQRAGPSTGMPTKTEQADLLQALYGRHGEAPLCVLAASSPSNCFEMAYEACRIATKYMTPVMLLTDGYITNGAEPWRIPDPASLPGFELNFAKENNNPGGEFLPYTRDEKTLARPWALPGTSGVAHRIGGLEKLDIKGSISIDAENHQHMCELRAEKIERISAEIPPIKVDGDPSGKLLVLSWGSTAGAVREALRNVRRDKLKVSHVHLHHISPLPADLGSVLKQFEHVLIPECNMGQLKLLIRSRYLVDAVGLNRITGQPLAISEVEKEILGIINK